MAALAHTHPFGLWRFSAADMRIAHGVFNVLGFGMPAMAVYLSVIRNPNLEMEVRLYTSDMNRNNEGRLIFTR